MKSCIIIQCYVKPIETLLVLQSLEKCDGIKEYDIILYVDKSPEKSKFEEPNKELIVKLKEYKNNNHHKYNQIIIFINQNNLGPYICCGNGIDYCFENYDYVIFTEDDAIFTKDAIKFYNAYRDNLIPNPEECISISAFSPLFITNNEDLNYVKENYTDKIHTIKKDII